MGSAARAGHPDPIARLRDAINAHDLGAIVACFADDYVNETPGPSRPAVSPAGTRCARTGRRSSPASPI